jgi:hypothetical protein
VAQGFGEVDRAEVSQDADGEVAQLAMARGGLPVRTWKASWP